jgi:hypothetical protein
LIGKYTTDSKEEARKNKDLIYLDRRVLNSIVIPKIRRCEYCRLVLSKYDGESKYCSTWCLEMNNSKHLGLTYNCRTCGMNIPYQTFKCKNCKRKKKEFIKIPKVKIKDEVGHTCKKCGEYKEWDLFSLVKGKRKLRCKECCAKDYLDYYNKNKERISLEHKEYYEKNKNKQGQVI